MKSLTIFINQSLRHFMMTGSIIPSSSRLARKMVKGISYPVIIELGPGTGVFTKEILNNLPKNGILISIESNQIFVNYIKDQIKDNRLKLYTGDALNLKNYLKDNGIKKVDCIISGLPIANLKSEIRKKLLNEISDCLNDEGVFIQFEYFLGGINTVRKVFPKISIDFELFNFPPAFVMRCKKIKK